MKGQKQEFSQDELKLFINEMKTSPESESSSLDHLIEDVLEEGATGSPVIEQEKRREERPKKFRLPLWLSVAFLSAFFLGSLFGFFWGKNQENARLSNKLFKREQELFSLIEELQKLGESSEKSECIEPLFEAKEPEKFAMKMFS